MQFIADFHIHSHYSLATSKLLTPQYLDYWGKIKGVNVVGTGDFTHPGWTKELKEYIEPAEEGLFKLKDEFVINDNPLRNRLFRFVLSAEISNIYKKNGKVRKVHNVVLAPNFQTVEKIQKKLQNQNFNITSDGRPILGLDSQDLFEMLLEIDENIVLIPAHIWTPWFAALGSKSGFDTIEECYGDLTKHIFAIETGLSSDQPLNWLCSFLDKFTLLSNSDAHSPEKLGRNANIFNTDLSYSAMISAMKNQQSNEFIGTIDMYPQEGKYHFDGHRKCNIVFNPTQTMEHKGICPVCNRPLTLGVAHRIAQLADRDTPEARKIKKDFKYIIPLKEIIAEIFGVRSAGKNVDKQYFKLINSLGSEYDILLKKDIEEIKHFGGEFLSIAIDRMRKNQVIIKEGFDGEYGQIKLFEKNEIKNFGSKKSLFDIQGEIKNIKIEKRPLLNFDVAKFRKLKTQIKIDTKQNKNAAENGENIEQKQAIEFDGKNLLIIAGPGTGKTYVLTNRIKFLVKQKHIKTSEILAITFSRQAANEIKQRLETQLDDEKTENLKISTFHALGFDIIKSIYPDFVIITEKDKHDILKELAVETKKIHTIVKEISLFKNTLTHSDDDIEFFDIFDQYNLYLEKNKLLDFDDLIYKINENYIQNAGLTDKYHYILIDEFQDINNCQYQFVKLLANEQSKLFAIGDPNQSIYAFRGSDTDIINKYISDFEPQIINLKKSYRCTDTILKASQNIIGDNNTLIGLDKGLKINISEHPTDKSEAEFIARTIEDMIGGLRFFSIDSKVAQGDEASEIQSLSDFAVLLRSKELFSPILKAFKDHSIPVQIISNTSFINQEPFVQITTILKYLANPTNKFLKKKTKEITQTKEIIQANNLQDTIKQIWTDIFEQKYSDKKNMLDKYLELSQNCNLEEFLSKINTTAIQDDYNPQIEAVSIMTMHASKGLEFKCVFIPALEQGLMPYSLFKKNSNPDEEKRLLYVAITRSKKYLFLSYAKNRMLKNMHFNFEKSHFINNIEKQLLEKNKQKLKIKPKDSQLNLFD